MHRMILALITLALLGGCAAEKRADQLDTVMKTYAASLRWGDFQRALSLVHPDERPEPHEIRLVMERFDQIRVTDYREYGARQGGDENEVLQTAEMRFSNRHTAVERSIQDNQVWRWDVETERWWLMSGLPDITRR